MKKQIIATLCITLCFSTWVYSQTYINHSINQPLSLQVNAGVDTMICVNDSVMIGSSPTALNGSPPYTYSWTPIQYLSDPLIANPWVVGAPAGSYTFTCTVTDSINCELIDQITVTVDPCVGMEDPGFLSGFNVFPNPNNGSFTIVLEGYMTKEKIQIDIINSLGQIVYNLQMNDLNGKKQLNIDLSSQSKGLYIARVIAGTQMFRKEIAIN